MDGSFESQLEKDHQNTSTFTSLWDYRVIFLFFFTFCKISTKTFFVVKMLLSHVDARTHKHGPQKLGRSKGGRIRKLSIC